MHVDLRQPMIEESLFSFVDTTVLEEGNVTAVGLVTQRCIIARVAKVNDRSNLGTTVLATECGSVGEIVAC